MASIQEQSLLDPSQVTKIIGELGEENKVLKEELKLFKERVNLLLAQLYGKKSEKIVPNPTDQMSYLDLPEAETDLPPAFIEVPAHDRKKKGRQALPANLPRTEVIHDISEEEKQCACGAELSRIGQESSEQLEYVPAKLEVTRHIRYKYACKSCEGIETEGSTVKIAPVPKLILPKGIASASLLTAIFIAKFVDGVPFYRQEKSFTRMGIGSHLSRSNMANWAIKLGILFKRLLFLLNQELLLGPLVFIDETTLQVLKEEGRDPTSKSYMWILCGGVPGKPGVLFVYNPSRASSVARQLLGGYREIVMADGYAGYNFITRSPEMELAGCWAHARRKFDDVLKAKGKKSQKRGTAEIAIDFIGQLYGVESKANKDGISLKERLKERQEQSKPIIEKFRKWFLQKELSVLPGSLTGKAIAYSLKRWDGLTLFLEHPEVPLDNNTAENAIRPFVIGRKNFLFSDTPKGAEANACMYSLIETAKANNLNPATYLQTLFERFPYTESDEQLKALLPQYIDLTTTGSDC